MTYYFESCITLDEAKKLYYELAKVLHPDKGGETKAFQELNNQFHDFKPGSEKFKGEADQWNSYEFASIINDLMKIKGLIIEVCGSWLWISGDTKPVKDQIKAVETGESYKRGWHKTKGLWYFSPTSYRKYSKEEKSIDEIRALYGSTTIKSKGTLVLN